MKKFKYILVISAAALLSSCASIHSPIHNNANNYQQATSVPPLQMPQGVKLTDVESAYPVPSHQAGLHHGQPSLKPPILQHPSR